jgi:hypothetical protein
VRPSSPEAPSSSRCQDHHAKAEWGHNIGDDYFLANYTQLVAYWKKLATQSDRIHVEDIGPTSMGRTQIMATVTSPANYKNLARYKDISRRLSLAEGLTDEQAARWRRKARRSSGLTAVCTPAKSSARSS